MATPILAITDGTTRVNLLTKSGSGINTCDYTPSRQTFKDGGVWADSSIADGRQLQMRKWSNIVDVLTLVISGNDQDTIIQSARNLTDLLEKAVSYWATDWQDEPVWIERRGSLETNTSYALIHGYNWANDDNPFKPPFYHVKKPLAMTEIDLAIEHGAWMSNPPGESDCVSISNIMDGYLGQIEAYPTANNDDAYVSSGSTEFSVSVSASTDDAYFDNTTSTAYLNQVLYIGLSRYDTAVRFENVTIPNGAVITSAFIKFRHYYFAVDDYLSMRVYGEDTDSPATYSTYANYAARTRTSASVAWAGTITGSDGELLYTPDIKNVVQEIVDLPAWGSGDDMAFMITGNSTDKYATLGSYDRVYPPQLIIYYETADSIQLAENKLVMKLERFRSTKVGIRFRDVAIANNVTINSAWIEFTNTKQATVESGSYNYIVIQGEDSATPAAFSTAVDFNGRSMTPSGAGWYTDSWGAGSVVKTTNIGNVISEIVNQEDWSSGNDLVLFLYNRYEGLDSHEAWFASVENTSYSEAKLVIQYYGIGETGDYLITEGDDFLLTEDEDFIITESSNLTGTVLVGNLGHEPTCLNEVYVSNKDNTAQLTHIYHYDTSAGAYSANLVEAVTPFDLLPDPLGVGDCIYFGSSNLFNSLVFDIGDTSGTGVLVWEYSIGGDVWETLNIFTDIENYGQFSLEGVGMVGWINPDSTFTGYTNSWATDTINGVPGFWVRARVTTADTVPTQINRQIYTVTRSYVDTEILSGDIPAISKINIQHAAHSDSVKGIIAVRSTSRGERFTPHINAVGQNNTSVTCSGSSTVGIVLSPTGYARWAILTPNETWTTKWTIELDSVIAKQYYGRYRAFVRFWDGDGGLGVSLVDGDISSRLSISMGVSNTTKSVDNIATADGYHYCDYGIITIPPAYIPDIYEGEVTINVQTRNNDAVQKDIYFLDLILVPIDEFAMEYTQTPTDTEGDLTTLDSTSYIGKRNVFSVLRKMSDYQIHDIPRIVSPSAIQLQAGAEQKIFFFVLEDCSYEWVGKVQIWKNERYLTFRGDD